MSLKSGIYQIVNIETGERYIGSTKNFNSRKASHLYDLRRNTHKIPKLQDAYNLYGGHRLEFLILEYVQMNRCGLIEREQYWIDLLKPEYNTNLIAGNVIPRSARTKEAKQKISSKVKELWKDPIYKDKHHKPRNWKNGVPNRRGVKLSDETKEKLRRANLGKNNHNYGKPKSQNFIDKVSKTYDGAISPDGFIYSPIINLRDFCRKHNLDSGQMSRVLNGKAQSHKGWTRI